jgi:hypothetical protein
LAGEARNLLCEGLIGKLAPRNDQGNRTGMSMCALPEGSGDVEVFMRCLHWNTVQD